MLVSGSPESRVRGRWEIQGLMTPVDLVSHTINWAGGTFACSLQWMRPDIQLVSRDSNAQERGRLVAIAFPAYYTILIGLPNV